MDSLSAESTTLSVAFSGRIDLMGLRAADATRTNTPATTSNGAIAVTSVRQLFMTFGPISEIPFEIIPVKT